MDIHFFKQDILEKLVGRVIAFLCSYLQINFSKPMLHLVFQKKNFDIENSNELSWLGRYKCFLWSIYMYYCLITGKYQTQICSLSKNIV